MIRKDPLNENFPSLDTHFSNMGSHFPSKQPYGHFEHRFHTEQFKPAIETIIATHHQFHGQLEVVGLKLEQDRASGAILVIYTFVRPFPFSFGLLFIEGGSRCSTKGVSDAFPIVNPKNEPEFVYI
ncbi:hypothetical protein TNIN_30021 [Trichonephila inaurata madagascariensis]|uniref:Uncharacterized protein n=1 Tax=Trichonephila inaurata madagascariensis TaxID=2747483 RepID=A0A8X7C074_9ARAC|nr:hypothetical protein TNIN_30021 [Trichonephila inaurata madagascariensis]